LHYNIYFLGDKGYVVSDEAGMERVAKRPAAFVLLLYPFKDLSGHPNIF